MAVRASCSSWSNSGTLLPFPGGHQEAQGKTRGGFRGRDGHGAELSVRSDRAEAFVHVLVKEEGAAYHTTGLRQKEFLLVESQALHEGGDESGKVVGGLEEQFAGRGIPLIRRANNHWKDSGEDFIGGAVDEGLHFVPGGDFEFLKN